jgi:carbon-monoxide dehydrogenase medium subunit
MYPFEYRRAGSVEEAGDLLAEREGARALAGGMSLLPAMKHRLQAPPRLVDLGQIADLRGIAFDGKLLTIGATTLHETVSESVDVRRAIPALSVLAGGIGDVQVRHRGTIGGSIANNDPAACYPSAVLALGATLHTNRREIPADSFFKGLFETALEPGELLTRVSFPAPDAAAYVKFQNLASRFSIVGVFVARFGREVRVAVTGAGPGVFRAVDFEARLSADFDPAVMEGQALSPQGLNSDLHGTAEYRAHLAGVLTQRAVAQCRENKK